MIFTGKWKLFSGILVANFFVMMANAGSPNFLSINFIP